MYHYYNIFLIYNVFLALSSNNVLVNTISFSSTIDIIGLDVKSNNNYYAFVSKISFNLFTSFNFVIILNTSSYSLILSLYIKYIYYYTAEL